MQRTLRVEDLGEVWRVAGVTTASVLVYGEDGEALIPHHIASSEL